MHENSKMADETNIFAYKYMFDSFYSLIISAKT